MIYVYIISDIFYWMFEIMRKEEPFPFSQHVDSRIMWWTNWIWQAMMRRKRRSTLARDLKAKNKVIVAADHKVFQRKRNRRHTDTILRMYLAFASFHASQMTLRNILYQFCCMYFITFVQQLGCDRNGCIIQWLCISTDPNTMYAMRGIPPPERILSTTQEEDLIAIEQDLTHSFEDPTNITHETHTTIRLIWLLDEIMNELNEDEVTPHWWIVFKGTQS
eukprot:323383_1